MSNTRSNTTHALTPEEIMAYLDGEMSAEEAESLATHLRDCADCASAADEMRGVSRALKAWAVEAAPPSLERDIRTTMARNGKSARPRIGLKILASGAVLAALLVAGVALQVSHKQSQPPTGYQGLELAQSEATASQSENGALTATQSRRAGAARMDARSSNYAALTKIAPGLLAPAPPIPGGASPASSFVPQGPMIARSVSLTVLVKSVPDARAALDALIAREQGYAAQLTFSTPETGSRSLQVSVRVPADHLNPALQDLRSLGRVQQETQSGEEVTQQHADLVARLQNSREEEQRLRGILSQRTGKIEDVLQVEEEIARVRGEIESMEAEQKALEHRVDYASVEVRLVEEYREQLSSPAAGTGTRVRNAFVAGIRNAGQSLLALLLFAEEFGPVFLLWTLILALPASLLWRRYKRARRSS